jgi:RNA polymerase sigma factor (sigma-70 family)
MLAARERLGLTQAQVAELADVQTTVIGALEALRFADVPKDGRQRAERVAGVLELCVDDIMPADLEGRSIQTVHVRRFEAPTAALYLPEYDRFNLPSPADITEKSELAEVLDHAISRLPIKCGMVVKRRFGVGRDQPQTLNEVAKELHCTRERVRQLEAKAVFALSKDPGLFSYLQPASARSRAG